MKSPLFNTNFLPDDFDFEGTRIVSDFTSSDNVRSDVSLDSNLDSNYAGIIRKFSNKEENATYEFDSILGSGAQGVAVKYSNPTRSVVLKFFPNSTTGNDSTRFSSDEGYKPFLNEEDFMKSLTLFYMMHGFADVMQRKGEIRINDKGEIRRRKEIILPGHFIDYSIDCFNNSELIDLLKLYAVTPILTDKTSTLIKGDINYFPVAEPSPNPSLSFSLGSRSAHLSSYEDGQNLDNILLENELSQEERVGLIHSLIYSVSYLHYVGIIHRDIKPEHFIVTANGMAKLIDLGISQYLSPSDRVARYADMQIFPTKKLKNPGATSMEWKGSRIFSSPQTYYQKKASNKDDIFSLGIILSIIQDNKHPFLSKYVNGYDEYIKLPPDEKLKIKRDYSLMMSQKSIKKGTLFRMHENYCKSADTTIKKLISEMIHPDEDKRINRMSLVAERMRISPPNIPPIFDTSEFFPFSKTYYTYEERTIFNEGVMERLPSARVLDFYPKYLERL